MNLKIITITFIIITNNIRENNYDETHNTFNIPHFIKMNETHLIEEF